MLTSKFKLNSKVKVDLDRCLGLLEVKGSTGLANLLEGVPKLSISKKFFRVHMGIFKTKIRPWGLPDYY
jgi:hypothetical protein